MSGAWPSGRAASRPRSVRRRGRTTAGRAAASGALSPPVTRASLRAVFMRRCSKFAGLILVLAALGSCGRREPPPTPPAPADTTTADTTVTDTATANTPATDSIPPPRADTVAAQPAFDYESRVGVGRAVGENLICLEITNRHLAPGDLVTLVSPLNRAYPGAARVVSSAGDSCAGATADSLASHYTLRLIQGGLDEGEFAIAVVGNAPTPRMRAGIMSADLDGDGELETFHECASREGIHLTIFTGSPADGVRRWHRYIYAGMDLEPNCTDAETRPPRAEGP
jgi:hypothetical protein